MVAPQLLHGQFPSYMGILIRSVTSEDTVYPTHTAPSGEVRGESGIVLLSMRRVIELFFIVLGVLFFLLLLFGVYLYTVDPFNLKPLFSVVIESKSADSATATSTPADHPLLNTTQEAALEAVGINPATLPTSISDEQEACFLTLLGTERVEAIKTGATPTASEVFATRECW